MSYRPDATCGQWLLDWRSPGRTRDSGVCPRRAPGLAVAMTLAILSSGAARADGTLVPPDPWEVIHVAREFGPAEVAHDSMQDPQIQGSVDGLHYRITFYGCRLGRNCDTILLDARFSRTEWADQPMNAKHFADWNAAKLFGRAWADEQGRAVLDHPVAIGPGLPKETLRATLERWKTALGEYAEHLGLR